MLLLIIFAALVLEPCTATDCFPSCTNSTAGDKVPDYSDCRRYYKCLLDNTTTDQPFSCPEGEKFDSVTSECMDETSADLKCASCDSSCVFVCPESGDFVIIADPNDCKNQIICFGTQQIDSPCPDDTPFFDGEKCQKDESRCCDPCMVYCDKEFIQVADPADCTGFYYCRELGPPSMDDHHNCPQGQNFDATTGHCGEDVMCTPVEKCKSYKRPLHMRFFDYDGY